MKKKRLRGTKLYVPKICVGTFQFTTGWKKSFEKKTLKNCLKICEKNDSRFIDTADSYQNGNVENEIGKYLKYKKRKKWIIATKFGQLNGYEFDKIEKNLNSSLRRLRTHYIDIYYFHSGTRKQFLNKKLWNYLNHKVKIGKIKYLGYSLSFKELMKFKKKDFRLFKKFNIKILQVVYNPLFSIAKKKIFQSALKHNISVIVRGSLAKGLLSSRHLNLNNFDLKRFKQKKIKLSNNKFYSLTNYMQNTKKNPIKLTFNNILKNKAVDSLVVGINNEKQLKENLSFFK
tara:strand:+ start:330 stop:1190 length:861 start_codon:yes stop_codon:yes gene_type:complete